MIINAMKNVTLLLLLLVSTNVFALNDSDSRKYDECIIESNKGVDHDRNTEKSAEKLCYQKFMETNTAGPSASEDQPVSSQNLNGSASYESYVPFQYENQPRDRAKAEADAIRDKPKIDAKDAKDEAMAKKQKICMIKANTYLLAADGRDSGFTPKQALEYGYFKHDGVSLAWIKEAYNQVYFDSRFINAGGNGLYMQMYNLCLFGPRRYEPLK